MASSPRSRWAIANANDDRRRIETNRSSGGSHTVFPRTAKAIPGTKAGKLNKGFPGGASQLVQGGEHLRAPLVPADLEEERDADEPESDRREPETGEEDRREPRRERLHRDGLGCAPRRAVDPGRREDPGGETARECKNTRRAEEDREAEGDHDRHPLGVEDLLPTPREVVIDPLPPLVHTLHEVRGLELLQVFE